MQLVRKYCTQEGVSRSDSQLTKVSGISQYIQDPPTVGKHKEKKHVGVSPETQNVFRCSTCITQGLGALCQQRIQIG